MEGDPFSPWRGNSLNAPPFHHSESRRHMPHSAFALCSLTALHCQACRSPEWQALATDFVVVLHAPETHRLARQLPAGLDQAAEACPGNATPGAGEPARGGRCAPEVQRRVARRGPAGVMLG